MIEITALDNLPVYTRAGKFVGNVKNAILDLDARRVDSLLLTKTNPRIVEGGRDVAVPFRWVDDSADILVLRYFPEFVATPVPDAGEADPHEVVQVTA